MVTSEHISFGLTITYSVAVPIIAVVYWRKYGPSNFLWLSDIALACTLVSLLTGHPLPASMATVGVLPLELAWTADFLAGGRLIGLAAYMYDAKLPLYLRCLSLFHLALPPTLLFLLHRYGYDERALVCQTLLTWVVLTITYLMTSPEKNINWVFGPGSKPQRTLPPLVYLGLELVVLTVVVFVPMHLVLKRLF
jgi:hypothetical protein